MSSPNFTFTHDEALADQYGDSSMPPNVLTSERAILGATLWHGLHVAYPLRANDFYRGNYRDLFQLIVDLYNVRPHIEVHDPIAVKDEMFRRGLPYQQATDMLFMYDEAIGGSVGQTSARYHVERVLETAEAREMQAFGKRLAQASSNPERTAAVMAEMQAAAADFRRRLGQANNIDQTQLRELVRVGRLAAATTPPAMSTGLIDLDWALNGGFRPATFNVLGARPGVGKSLLAGSIAVHMGSTNSTRVLYVTMELSAAEVTNRMLANISGVDLTKLQNPEQLDDHDRYELDFAEERLADYPIHVVEGSKTIEQIEDVGRDYLGNVPSGLMIVDFLGRIREDGTASNRERHVALCASRLTDLSRELRIPLLCVVSFSRSSVRETRAPRMDDIRDSGNVESDADTVLLMWQPKQEDLSRVQVVIDKNRYGDVGVIHLRRQGYRGRLVNEARTDRSAA